MAAFLSVTHGPACGQTFVLPLRSVLIGRDASCAIPIPDERISRRHLQVTYDNRGRRHLAVDVGSSNGVTINGARLVRGAEWLLGDGDEIAIGGTRLRYSVGDKPEPVTN